VIPAAKKPGPGRPRKAEKEPWRARVPSTYSRFVKEAYSQAEKNVADVKNATSVMPSIAKLWREAPQSQKDRFAPRRPACQCHFTVLRAGDRAALKLSSSAMPAAPAPACWCIRGRQGALQAWGLGCCAVLCSRVCLPRVLLRELRRGLPRDNTHLGYHPLTASDRTRVSNAGGAPGTSVS